MNLGTVHMKNNMRRCLTSGMILRTKIKSGIITITVETPNQLWDENSAKQIDERLHDGIEYALAPYWKEGVVTNEKT